MNCQHCQPLLLDHLYGLLDAPESAAVDAHLASCASCAAARTETARVQGLIARAAKSAFPNVRFEAPPQPAQPAKPARTPAPVAGPNVLPFPANPGRQSGGKRRSVRIGTIIPWAVAAAVLIAIPGTVIPVVGMFRHAESTQRDAVAANREADSATQAVETVKLKRETRLSDAQMRLTAAEQTQNALLNKWLDEQKSTMQATANRKLRVDVLKPASIQPGAPNEFLLVVNDQRDRWESRGTKMVAEVHAIGATDAVLFSQTLDHQKAGDKHALRLPADVWAKVKPNTELYLVVAEEDVRTGTRTELLDKIRLAGPVYTTLLVTDKPTYRPGDRLFFRSLTLDRVTFRPPAREQILKYELISTATGRPVSGVSVTGTTDLVRVVDGRVESVRTADGQPIRGVGCGEFVLPADLADGDYILTLSELRHPGGFPITVPAPVTRLVKVRAGAIDTYRKQIGFAAASYTGGETVDAWAELKFQGKPVTGATVAGVVVEADGTPVTDVKVTEPTDADGRARLRFTLPADVTDGDVRLKVTFRTPGGEEEVADRVPVIGSRLIVEFFPECGDKLVAGVPCKVYVRATTPAGQPVDIRGIITDGRETLAVVKTLRDDNQPGANRGLASFTYTPKLGTRVWLKLQSPAGVSAPIMTEAQIPSAAVGLFGGAGAVAFRTGFPLPMPAAEGLVMTVPDVVTSPGQAIRVHLHSVGQPRTIVVGAYIRGRLSDTQKITVEPGQVAEVRLMANLDPSISGRGGVVRITAFEEIGGGEGEAKAEFKPVAERLVFRKPGELLNLTGNVSSTEGMLGAQMAPNQPPANFTGFPAGSAMNLNIRATDEKGNPVAAILWAAAVNYGLAPGPKDRLMPTHFLLAGEVKNPDDLEFADFLLTNDPKEAETAAKALDLVLATQGWRRFAEQGQPANPGVKPYPVNLPNPDMTQFYLNNGQYLVSAESPHARDQRRLYETYAPRYEAAVNAVKTAKLGLEAVQDDKTDTLTALELGVLADNARRSADEKTASAGIAREPVQQFRANVWYGIAGLAALAVCCAVVSLARPTGRLPMGVSACGSFGLAVFLVVAAGWGEEAKASGVAQNASPALAEQESAHSAPLAPVAPAPREGKNADSATDKATLGPGMNFAPPGGPKLKGIGPKSPPTGGGMGGFHAPGPFPPSLPPGYGFGKPFPATPGPIYPGGMPLVGPVKPVSPEPPSPHPLPPPAPVGIEMKKTG
ncbi:MAG: zf-HC2 domain-containing protein, partial [Planctomycetia bacterium]|nr:zf-HC2 domain-containing protein [Planctomycetia bacterium]